MDRRRASRHTFVAAEETEVPLSVPLDEAVGTDAAEAIRQWDRLFLFRDLRPGKLPLTLERASERLTTSTFVIVTGHRLPLHVARGIPCCFIRLPGVKGLCFVDPFVPFSALELPITIMNDSREDCEMQGGESLTESVRLGSGKAKAVLADCLQRRACTNVTIECIQDFVGFPRDPEPLPEEGQRRWDMLGSLGIRASCPAHDLSMLLAQSTYATAQSQWGCLQEHEILFQTVFPLVYLLHFLQDCVPEKESLRIVETIEEWKKQERSMQSKRLLTLDEERGTLLPVSGPNKCNLLSSMYCDPHVTHVDNEFSLACTAVGMPMDNSAQKNLYRITFHMCHNRIHYHPELLLVACSAPSN